MIQADGLWELIERRAAATPDALMAVDDGNRQLSFAAYRDAALRCAAGLHARGIGAGDRVAWMLPTWLETLVLAAALSRIGAVQIPILPIYRAREVDFIAGQTGARRLFVPGVFRGFDYAAMAREVAGAQPALGVEVIDRELPEGDVAALPPAPSDGAAVRWIFYTSGTTADPKGALHTDATLAAFSAGMADALALAPDDRVALVFPFTHVGGLGWLFAGLMTGCAHIVVPAFDPATSIGVLARHGVTQATAGTVFHQAYLAAQRERGDVPIFPQVRAFPGGGAPKPPQLHFDLAAEIGGAGIVSGYGLTECPILTMNRVGDDDGKLAHTEGRPSPPEVEIRVVDMGGASVPPGGEGELRVRGPQLCRGYLDATLDGAAFDADGFFRTGDLGLVDADGYVTITGRLKDVIIRKGENISAVEVENMLFSHPDVADVAVVGLPDPETGERACAVVVPTRPERPLGFEEMKRYLRERGLMVQKLPERLEHMVELPRNPTGKVLKHELRARFSGESSG